MSTKLDNYTLTDAEITDAVGWRGPGAMRQIKTVIAKAVSLERERICAAIKTEDDHCADGDYMMDSDDCIAVAKGTWERPDWGDSNKETPLGAVKKIKKFSTL